VLLLLLLMLLLLLLLLLLLMLLLGSRCGGVRVLDLRVVLKVLAGGHVAAVDCCGCSGGGGSSSGCRGCV